MNLPLITLQPGGARPPTPIQKANIRSILDLAQKSVVDVTIAGLAAAIENVVNTSADVVSFTPPLDPLPVAGLRWFDPSDGSTSVWMWLDPTAANDSKDYGVFVSQFPTPAESAIPTNAYLDKNGEGYTDLAGNYYTYPTT